MSEQHMVRLIDISVMKMGETIIAAQCTGDGYPVYSADTGNEPWNFTNKLKIKNSRGSLVVGARGSIGNPRIPDFDIFGATQTTIVIIPDIKKLEPKYLYYALKALDFKTLTAQQAVPMLTIGDISKIKIPYIDKIAQKSVTAILEVIDQAIEKTEALIHKYQQIKAGLMHDLFTRGVTADGKLRPPREQAPELYKETPVGWIPKEWNVKRVGDLCLSIVPGRDKPILDGGYLPWITVSDIERLNVFESLEGLSLSRNSLKKAHGRTIPKRAVIMSCVGSFGLVAITGKELVINQQLHAFVVGDKIIPEWLAFNLERQERYMNKIATQTTIRYLNKDSCESVPIVVPTKNEQQLLVERIISISDQIFVEQQVVSKLKKQKSGLMHDLLTGKVQVKVDKEETTHV